MTYNYTEIQWIELNEWPLEDSEQGVEIANRLAPNTAQWVRMYGSNPGFALLKEGVHE